MGLMILAFLWGLAEASFFFIIPDVILTFIAIQGFNDGLNASLIALLGALIGGSIMYKWSISNFDRAYRFVSRVPAINEKMLDDVRDRIKEKRMIAVILGPIRGIPYKTFAIMAPRSGISFFSFIIASVPARFIRFFITSFIAYLLANVFFPHIPDMIKYLVWVIVWIIVYVIYFSIHPIKVKSQ